MDQACHREVKKEALDKLGVQDSGNASNVTHMKLNAICPHWRILFDILFDMKLYHVDSIGAENVKLHKAKTNRTKNNK